MHLLHPTRKKFEFALFAIVISISLFGCGGGGGGGGGAAATPTPTSHAVNISWTANREAEVNKAGGGYIVAVSGQLPVTLPYASTAMSTTLMSGNYTVTVTAYSALNPPGGVTGSKSAPAVFSFSVPY